MINTNKKGFTLVELIVVITILAILGTIGFISLQGYSSEARDSKRVTDLRQIATGIQVYQAKEGVLPEPNDSITVGSGSTTYLIQGYAGTGTLRNIKVNDDAKDPLEENYYTYTTNGSKTKFQLLTLLENNNTAYNHVIPKTYDNYETRKSYVIGDKLGTLLEPTTNTPLQELGNDIDLSVNTTEYIPVFSKNNEGTTYSGEQLEEQLISYTNNEGSCNSQGELLTATTTYPGCDTSDIIVCSGAGAGYTISACNVGATTASIDWTVSRGEYFQWGRNKGFAYGDNTQQATQIANASYDLNNDTYGFVWNSNLSSYRYDWIVNQDDNLWGDNSGAGTSEQRQGPCPTGYHVPSQPEWSGIVTAGQWGTNGANMQTALKLPYAGLRRRDNGAFDGGGSFGGYWSSSPYGTFGYGLYFYSSNIYPSGNDYRADGFSVRCFKN